MALPKKLSWDVAQDRWASQLDPLLAAPSNSMSILPNILLSGGTNVINHMLGARLQGWTIVRKRANANIYDKQDSNQTPDLTLVLVSDAPVMIDLGVF